MTKIWLGIAMFSLSICASAQDWQPDYALALTKAEATKKPLIVVFAGTDWCAPCIKLDREVWQSETFQGICQGSLRAVSRRFSQKKIEPTFARTHPLEQFIGRAFNPQGHFPLVLVIDSKEQVLGSTGYRKLPPEQYISLLNSFLK